MMRVSPGWRETSIGSIPIEGGSFGHVKTIWGTGWRVVAVPSSGLSVGFSHVDVLAV